MKAFVKQALHFFGLSGIGWLLDFGTFTLLGMFSENLVLNNFLSSWVGVSFVFFTATRNVFKNNSRISLRIKYLIYLVYQFILILLMSKLLDAINMLLITKIDITFVKSYAGILSKILVTPISMILNFFVMKYVIEKL